MGDREFAEAIGGNGLVALLAGWDEYWGPSLKSDILITYAALSL